MGTWAPRKCKFFLWLVAHDRCWTADTLAHRGLPHPEHCPLCDQEEESISHLLSACVFARQFWHRFLSCFGLQDVTPCPNDADFFLWWQQAGDGISSGALRGFNTLVVLGAWTIWKAKNDDVFNEISPRIGRALLLAREEAELWMLAGAKGLGALVAVALLNRKLGDSPASRSGSSCVWRVCNPVIPSGWGSGMCFGCVVVYVVWLF